MKALAISCAVSKLELAAINEDKICSVSYDIGMKQSETLLPAIDYILNKTGLKSNELDFTTLTIGPGSFTGLRLGISALKAIECAFNVPVYGLSSLEVYAYPYKNYDYEICSAIDANKDRFYARVSKDSECLIQDGDFTLDELKEKLSCKKKVLFCGPDGVKLCEALKDTLKDCSIFIPDFEPNSAEVLLKLTQDKIKNGTAPLKDFDGPVYLRASEAEIKLNEGLL